MRGGFGSLSVQQTRSFYVIRYLPLAESLRLEEHKDGKFSKAAGPAEVAEVFAQIDGYKVVDAKGAKPAAAKKEEKPVEAPAEEAVAETAAPAKAKK